MTSSPTDLPITADPEILSGARVFTGTRVPVSALLDNLEAGISVDEFLENYPTVTREQVLQIVEHFQPDSCDPEFHEEMKVALRVMREDREVLRKLAE